MSGRTCAATLPGLVQVGDDASLNLLLKPFGRPPLSTCRETIAISASPLRATLAEQAPGLHTQLSRVGRKPPLEPTRGGLCEGGQNHEREREHELRTMVPSGVTYAEPFFVLGHLVLRRGGL
jgi:hypothetical protein